MPAVLAGAAHPQRPATREVAQPEREQPPKVVVVGNIERVNIPEALESLGGFAHRHELVGEGCWPAMIDLSLYYRKILRVRQGQYASVGTPPAVLRALRVGGRLACVSALAYYQLGRQPGAGAEGDPLHVLVRHGASRLGIHEPVVVHWTRREVEGTRLVVSERAARAQAAWCRATGG